MAENEAAEAQDEPDEQEDAGQQKGGRLMSIVLLFVGLGGGGAAGMFFVGPMVTGGSRAAGAESAESGADGSSGEHSGEGVDGSGQDGERLSHTIANVIVNPAGSGGSRILLVDVVVRVSGEETTTELESRDDQIRDLLGQLLGSRTAAELSDVSRREALKEEIRLGIQGIAHSGEILAVFLPRYVIQ